MASIEEFINRTAENVNNGIKEKIEDGSFNRLGEGLGEGVKEIADGVVTILGKAKETFSKLNEKADAIGKPKTPQGTETESPSTPPPTQETPPSSAEQPPPPPSQEEPGIFCGQCGQKNPPDALFCCACGSRLQQAAQESPTPPDA